jgi:hypothetical protein
VDGYPAKFGPLVSAILKLSSGRLGFKVDYEGVRDLFGDKQAFLSLNTGFQSFKQLIGAACAEGCTEQGKLGEQKWIMLLEVTVSSSPFFRHYHPEQLETSRLSCFQMLTTIILQ